MCFLDINLGFIICLENMLELQQEFYVLKPRTTVYIVRLLHCGFKNLKNHNLISYFRLRRLILRLLYPTTIFFNLAAYSGRIRPSPRITGQRLSIHDVQRLLQKNISHMDLGGVLFTLGSPILRSNRPSAVRRRHSLARHKRGRHFLLDMDQIQIIEEPGEMHGEREQTITPTQNNLSPRR